MPTNQTPKRGIGDNTQHHVKKSKEVQELKQEDKKDEATKVRTYYFNYFGSLIWNLDY